MLKGLKTIAGFNRTFFRKTWFLIPALLTMFLSTGPVTPVFAASGVTAIAAGANHSMALKSDGSVVAWGDNTFGQTTVPAFASFGMIAIAAGNGHSVSLKSDGSVVAWGDNSSGQTTVPTNASSGVAAIASGASHTVALKSDGSVVAWGDNASGQTTVPVSASSGVIAIAAGAKHTVALKSNGSVVAWGDNISGQIVLPPSASSGVIAIAAGANHTVVLMNDGSVVVWGSNFFDQTTVPTTASNGVIAIAAGYDHAVTLKSDDTVVAWGSNSFGQTTVPDFGNNGVRAIASGGFNTVALKNDGSVFAWGYAGEGEINVPAAASSGVKAISAGALHALALKNNGSVVAWGSNHYGQTTVPATASNGVKAIVAGGTHSLALKSDGTVVAWGLNYAGITTVPASASSGVLAIAAGDSHSVALKSDGSVVAWGYNSSGQTTVPTSASSGVIAISSKGNTNLALKNDGSVVAWGDNSHGQATVPASASTDVIAIAAGYWHNIALKSNGSVVAWGDNSFGQTTVPATALSGVIAIAAGWHNNYALKSDGSAVAWGRNEDGQSTLVAIAVKPSGTVSSGQNVIITGDVGGLSCQWNGTALSGTCVSNTLIPSTKIVLTANMPADSRITWGTGCNSVTETTCTINSLRLYPTIISPVISVKTVQTITFNPPTSKTYGDLAFDLSTYANGGASGNPVTFAVTSGPGSLSGSTLATTGAGNIVITASQAGNAIYSAAPDVQRSITVAKANATIALANLNQTYDGTAKSVLATTNPSNIGFVINYTDISGNPAVTRINAGDYNVSAIITDSNYQGSATGILTITKAPQSFTFNPLASVTYGAADFGPGAIPPEGQTISYNSDNQAVATIIPSGLIHITGAGTAQITATILGDANHLPASIQQALTVNPAILIVTSLNASRVYGAVDPAFSARYIGFVNNETVSVISGSPVFTTTVTASSPVGSYPISVSTGNLSHANYTFSFVPGVLTISKASASITLGNLSQTYDGTARSATVTTDPTGLPVTIGYTDAAGNPVASPINVGSYTVTVVISNPNYQGSATGALTIIPRAEPKLTISADSHILWPPNNKMVPVTIGGGVELNGAEMASLKITVTDEYGKYNYSNLQFGSVVKFEAARNGNDMDGRIYTITAELTLKDGRIFTAGTTVIVPHDMSGHE